MKIPWGRWGSNRTIQCFPQAGFFAVSGIELKVLEFTELYASAKHRNDRAGPGVFRLQSPPKVPVVKFRPH